jgi:hypothetical protein
MIDFDKMSEHEIACYLIGAAIVSREVEAKHKEGLFRVFYYKEDGNFVVQYYGKNESGSDIFSELRVEGFQEVYDYLMEIL